jgi:hypothetical protein
MIIRKGCGRVAALVVGLMAAGAQAAIVWVNPSTGNDGGSGTVSQPVKTISRAVVLARDPSNVIVLAPGTYSSASGETFGWAFNRVTFIGNTSTQAIVIDGAGVPNVMHFGTGSYARFIGVTLQNMSQLVSYGELAIEKSKLVNFAAGLRVKAKVSISDTQMSGRGGLHAEDSTIELTRVTMDGSEGGGGVSLNHAKLFADELVIHDVVGESQVIDVVAGSQAELRNSSIADSWGTGYETSSFLETAVTVRVGSDSKLWMIDSSISGSRGIAVFGDLRSTVKIDGGSLTGNLVGVHSLSRTELNISSETASTAYLRNTLANWRVEGSAALALLDDADFRSGTFGVQSFSKARVSVSNSTFRGVSRPLQLEDANAGQTSIALGHNLYFYGNADNYSSVVATCTGPTPVYLTVTGSKWRPNVQGADAEGYFESQVIPGIKKGNNYWLKTSVCRLEVN